MEHAAYPARVRWRVEGGGAVRRILTAFLLLPLIAFSQASDWYMDFDEDFAAASSKKAEPVTLTFEYVSTYPATITIGGGSYGQPADPSKALVDAGDGVFVPWTSNTITVKGKRIRFRGDWRNASGNFRELFNGTFADGNDVTMSGGFDFTSAPVDSMFRSTFARCSNLTGSIPSGLFGNLTGAPADRMFAATFLNCSKLTGESALMPDGTTHLYEQFPTASGTQCDNCYFGATGLADYATIPDAWK